MKKPSKNHAVKLYERALELWYKDSKPETRAQLEATMIELRDTDRDMWQSAFNQIKEDMDMEALANEFI
ncbi:hypothetical protein V2T23_09930 [Streptococcus agalactiae]|uniref:Uncharacterized protein n=5 Tax=Caudoviricetes TaxID=2731619 RepID=A0A384X222_9CAUD|nr:hypothetical protein HOT89_gp45 [Vibrio phage vB_VpaP_KF1]YP_009808094.1 hypothetical protein HOT90_gp32 [Vibrio phage vB_VpaP_KF2]QWE49802.1 hypothetical protein [Vibrio phage BUCT233]UPO38826.1 hypothetical protein GHSM17_26 [Vibrio phage vB_VpaP_GHSM17]UUW39457.1 hypothetical protein vBVpaP1701_24 [Vibrio phage vB_VpaP_1701]ATI19067.1 hypothetical protein KF1_045 [Vibrio phage vB_VpaP_KF1]ATI19100.1 hypothetical protein KF2_032 [Vibrio phage vB_VpaP_KF2]